ncbi:SDR family oxidoreductase [Gordonia sp. (in: high G+C Gram-positive bacteria)]|uniref:SDR family oxidoreductase n=1 Tax=Gordonia sp. (in: high G+C Gram-positive bacteria) TaxID=84139 RepID=UPI003F984C2A
MAKSLAVEVARRGITVNTVIPGFVETEIIATGDALEALTASWLKIPAESDSPAPCPTMRIATPPGTSALTRTE